MKYDEGTFSKANLTFAKRYIESWKKTGKLPTELRLENEHKDTFSVKQVLEILKLFIPLNPFEIDSISIPVDPPTEEVQITYKDESEYSMVILKPDAVKRGIEGAIIQRFLDRGLNIEFIYKTALSHSVAIRHYEHLKDKPYFHRVYGSILSGELYVLKVSGEGCVKVLRKLAGSTDPLDALPGTIRGDYGTYLPYNIIHASDCFESARRECENLITNIILT